MKNQSILLIVIILLSVMSCGPSRNNSEQAITEMEDVLFDSNKGIINKQQSEELVSAYIEFADNYPDDSLSSEYLFKGGDIMMNTNHPQEAINLYDRIINNYPDFRKAPECLFLKGYIYENYLNDLDQAKVIYTKFIIEYPDNDFADDAQISIDNLGKSPEELIKEFEEKMKAQEAEN